MHIFTSFRTFFGTLRQQIAFDEPAEVEDPVRSQDQAFSSLLVDVPASSATTVPGLTRDIYDALDTLFEPAQVELESRSARRHIRLIAPPPPVLQVQLQRVQYDRERQSVYKSNAHLAFEDELDVGRYLESQADDADLQVKHSRTDAAREELRKVRARLTELAQNTVSPRLPFRCMRPPVLNSNFAVVDFCSARPFRPVTCQAPRKLAASPSEYIGRGRADGVIVGGGTPAKQRCFAETPHGTTPRRHGAGSERPRGRDRFPCAPCGRAQARDAPDVGRGWTRAQVAVQVDRRLYPSRYVALSWYGCLAPVADELCTHRDRHGLERALLHLSARPARGEAMAQV